jgi:hypothetical protein
MEPSEAAPWRKNSWRQKVFWIDPHRRRAGGARRNRQAAVRRNRRGRRRGLREFADEFIEPS